MKRINYILGLIGAIILVVASCSPDYQTNFATYTLFIPDSSNEPIVMQKEGGKDTIIVQTNIALQNWEATCNASWCKLDKREGAVYVDIEPNSIYVVRKAFITIKYGHQQYMIPVTQVGLQPIIEIGEGKDKGLDTYKYIIPAEQQQGRVDLITNLNIDHITVPDTVSWIKNVRINATRANRSQLITFDMTENVDTVERFCTIILQSSQNYQYAASFLIKQDPSKYLVRSSVTTFEVKDAGGYITVPILTNGPVVGQKNGKADASQVSGPYTISIEEDAQSWIHLTPKTRGLRESNEIFKIDPNTEESPREGRITFTSFKDQTRVVVLVKQAAFVPVNPNNVSNVTATPGPGYITLNWQKPEVVNYSKLKVTFFDRILKETRTVEVTNNQAESVKIDGTYKCVGEYTFTITTIGPTGLVTESPVEVKGTSEAMPYHFERITLTAGMLSTNANHDGDGGGVPAVVDGNKGTFLHTKWGNPTEDSRKPHFLQIVLPEKVLGVYVAYDGRQGNNAGDVSEADIYVCDHNTTTAAATFDEWHKAGLLNFNIEPNKTNRDRHYSSLDAANNKEVIFNEPYQYIRFIPISRRQGGKINNSNGTGWWNLSEFYLYVCPLNDHNEAWAEGQLGI